MTPRSYRVVRSDGDVEDEDDLLSYARTAARDLSAEVHARSACPSCLRGDTSSADGGTHEACESSRIARRLTNIGAQPKRHADGSWWVTLPRASEIPGAREMIDAIRRDSVVGRGSCSTIDECFSDEELAELVEACEDVAAAVSLARRREGESADRALDQRWGDDDDPQLEMKREFDRRLLEARVMETWTEVSGGPTPADVEPDRHEKILSEVISRLSVDEDLVAEIVREWGQGESLEQSATMSEETPRLTCPACGSATRLAYAGGNPENGPARRECSVCGWDVDSAEYEAERQRLSDVWERTPRIISATAHLSGFFRFGEEQEPSHQFRVDDLSVDLSELGEDERVRRATMIRAAVEMLARAAFPDTREVMVDLEYGPSTKDPDGAGT